MTKIIAKLRLRATNNTQDETDKKTIVIRKGNKPTNVGRIALERQARQFNSGAVA